MQLKHFLPGVACFAILAGCASTVTTPPAKPAPVTVSSAMTEAETAIVAGQPAKGMAILSAAAQAYPADKQPWLRMAQHNFDSHDYGKAIVEAQEVLERDQDDLQAHSILAVAGLRVSVKALSDLAQKNNLNGSVRSEAQDLAKLLRARLGDELVPGMKKAPKTVRLAPSAPATTPKPRHSDDPFANF